MRCLSAVVAAAGLAAVHAAYAPDKIASLPGWSGALPSDMYSGYLDIPGGKHLSYVAAFSENNPATDPTVFWFNGGPGCSSLGGFATENGPFFLLKEGTKWALRQRPERWNKAANMVWMENPAGVGFSYADSPAGYVHNDSSTAVDNYNAVQGFFNKFPEWRNNSLFFTGESYAGIYIPTLAQQIVQHNQAGNEHINLKGIAVGNGCIGTEVGTCGQGGTKYNFEFLSGQGFLSPGLVADIEADCTNWANPSNACQDDLVAMYAQEGNVNVYDVYVGCGALAADDDAGKPAQHGTYSWTSGGVPEAVVGDYEAFMARRFKQRPATELEKKLLAAVWAKKVAAAGGERALGATDGPCVAGDAYTAWYNDPAVRTALHMKSASQIGAWTDCTSKIQYTSTEANEPRDVYPTLVANMRVLIYNGAFDNCVPWTDNVEWTTQFAAVNKAPVAKGWSPWYVDNHLAGHSQYWNIGHGFGFTTIVAAGHLVPQYQPKFGAAMLSAFLAGQQL